MEGKLSRARCFTSKETTKLYDSKARRREGERERDIELVRDVRRRPNNKTDALCSVIEAHK